MKKYIWMLVVFSLIVIPFTVHGADYQIQNEWIDGVYGIKYQGAKYYYGPMSMLKLGSKVGYCMDPYLLLGDHYERDDTILDDYSDSDRAYFQLLGYYAGMKGGSRYYLAAQELIWRRITHDEVRYTTENMGKGDPVSVDSEKQELTNWVSQMMNGPSIPSNLTGRVFETKTWVDTNGVLDQYQILNYSHHDVQIKDNVLIITFLDDQPANLDLVYRTPGELEGYRAYGAQQVAFFGGYEKRVPLTLETEDVYRVKLSIQHTFEERDVGGTFRFQVRNLQTNELVQDQGNTVFETYPDGSFLSDFTLEKGNYIIEYLSASEPFLKPENRLLGVSYDEGNTSILKIEVPVLVPTGTLQVTRTETGSFLSQPIKMQGVQYDVYRQTDFLNPFGEVIVPKDTFYGTFYTDSNGFFEVSQLPLGSYYLVETCDFENCVATSSPIVVELFYYDDQIAEVFHHEEIETSFLEHTIQVELRQEIWNGFSSQPDYGWLGVDDQVKLFAEEVTMRDFYFWNPGEEIASFSVQNGEGIFLMDLPKGTYFLQTCFGKIPFKITDERLVSFKKEQILEKGAIEVVVEKESGDRLADIPFLLQYGEQLFRFETGKNGSYFIPSLPYGTYQLTDIQTGDSYVLMLEQPFLQVKLIRNEQQEEPVIPEDPKEEPTTPEVPKEEPTIPEDPMIDPDVDQDFPEVLPDTRRTTIPSILFLLFGYGLYQKIRH